MPVFYYDSCVFGNAANPSGPEHADCQRITDAPYITWQVAYFRELVSAETTFGSLVEAFEVQCALNGVIVHNVSTSQVTASSRAVRQHRVPLSKLGLSGNDWRHVCAALVPPCQRLVTTDSDFVDPVKKRGGATGHRVSRYLIDNLGLQVSLPSAVP